MGVEIDPEIVGLVSCVVATLGFGTQGVFVKSKKIIEAEIHPLLIAMLYSLCIAFIGAIIGLAVLARGSSFLEHGHKRVYGPAVAAIAFAPGNLLLLWSCRRIGVGFAVGVVASTASISSFVIGTAMGDSFSPVTQVLGILLMVVGIVFISATKVPLFEDWIDPIPQHLLLEVLGDTSKPLSQMPGYAQLQESLIDQSDDRQLSADALALIAQEEADQNSLVDRGSKDSIWSSGGSDIDCASPRRLDLRRTDPGPTRLNPVLRSVDEQVSSVGYSAASGGTLFLSPSGASLLEHRLKKKRKRHIRKSMERRPVSRSLFMAAVLEATENYDLDMDWAALGMALVAGVCLGVQGVLFSEVIDIHSLPEQLAMFMVTQFFVTLVILLPSFCCDNLFQSKVDSPVLLSLRYAMAGALCFCCAVTGQVVAVTEMPVNVAMPLTQLNIVVAGLWSILYFGEVESPRLIAVFASAMIVVVLGAVLLVI